MDVLNLLVGIEREHTPIPDIQTPAKTNRPPGMMKLGGPPADVEQPPKDPAAQKLENEFNRVSNVRVENMLHKALIDETKINFGTRNRHYAAADVPYFFINCLQFSFNEIRRPKYFNYKSAGYCRFYQDNEKI